MTDPRPAIRPILGFAALLAAIYLVLVGPMIALEARRPHVSHPDIAPIRKQLPSELKDQDDYHLPVIETMMDQWPRPDIVEYESATAPGYHLLMAASSRLTTGTKTPMLVLNAFFGLGLILCIYAGAVRFVHPAVAATLTLPVLASKYVLGAGIWLTTDNAALMFVALALVLTVMRRRPGPVGILGGGLSVAAAVAIRQIHLWALAPVGFAGLLASPLARWVPRAFGPAPADERHWRNLLIGVIAAAMPLGVVATFVILWGGLVPVSSGAVTDHDAGFNPATFAFAFALAAPFGVFMLPVVEFATLRDRMTRRLVAIAATVGVIAAIAPPTAWARNVRDYGWLWRPVVEKAPDIAGRSLVLVVLAPVGAAIVALLYLQARRRGRGPIAAVLLLTMCGWLLAQSLNAMAWQRYFEPLTLVTLVWLASLAVPDSPVRRRNLVLAAGVLGVGQLGVTLLLVYLPALRSLL